jgi:hypothetical protein
VDVDHVWPQTLRLPARTRILRAVDKRTAVFPLSESVYFEISKIGRHRQRRDLREVVERASRYMIVMSRSVISSHEIEALLDQIVGPNPHPINTMDYLDWAVARSFGMVGSFRVRTSSGEDVTAEVRLQHPDAQLPSTCSL